MSTATVETPEPTPPTPAPSAPPSSASERTSLLISSLIGAVILLAGFVAGGYIAQQVPSNIAFYEVYKLGALLLVYAAGFVAVWQIFRANPPKGIRGGIFLVFACIVGVILLTRLLGGFLTDMAIGSYITAGVLFGLVFLGYKFLISERAYNWMLALDEQGWFYTFNFKKNQGKFVRRCTQIGVIIIGLSGLYSISQHTSLGSGDWLMSFPFTDFKLPLLPLVEVSGLLLLGLFTGWIAWRLVNIPSFADFLIATEAEMNKVSWSTRKKLTQDTIVVLVTVVLITLFLLVIDLFWGWILSVKYIEVLPKRQDSKQQMDRTGQKKTEW